jgi:hypothetical protein
MPRGARARKAGHFCLAPEYRADPGFPGPPVG